MADSRGRNDTASNTAAVLMYHRVFDGDADAFNICVSPQNFDEQMSELQRSFTPMQLSELVPAIQHNTIPDRAVVVTFDDGYEDNGDFALPLLRKFGIPATFFIVSGTLDGSTHYWWDELANLFQTAPLSAGDTQVEVGGQALRLPFQNNADRATAIASVHKRLMAHPADRQRVLTEISSWANVDYESESYQVLQRDRLSEIATDALIELGAHSVSHPQLPKLAVAQQQAEVSESLAAIAELTHRPVPFAYPFGDHNDETVEIVRSSGAECAVTVEQHLVDRNTDLFRIPRFHVHDWSGSHFRAKLDAFFQTQ